MALKRTLRLIAITCSLVLTPSALAEESRFFEEVIVTAEKVKKSAQDTALSITAMDETFIDDFGMTLPEDVAIFIPSFSRTEFDFTIRGIGRNFRVLGGEPGVATYQNGMYFEDAYGPANEGQLYDVQRIEVLRGPQGTLYGRNSIGGVVNYITNPPSAEFEGEVMTVFGNNNREEYYGFVSGPVMPGLINGRLVGSKIGRAGDRSSRAVSGQEPVSDTGGFKETNLALSLDITPTDHLQIFIRGNHRDEDSVPRAELHVGEGTLNRRTRSSAVCFPEGTDCFNEAISTTNVIPVYVNAAAHQNIPISGNGYGDNLDNFAYPDYKPWQYLDVTTGMVDVQWSFGYDQFTLRYIGGHSDFDFGRDAPWGVGGGRNQCLPPTCEPGPGGEQLREDHFHVQYEGFNYANELQLISNLDGRWNFVAGLYRYYSDHSQYWDFYEPGMFGTYLANPSPAAFEPCCGPPSFPGRHNVGVGTNPDEDGVASSFAGSERGSYLWLYAETQTTASAAYSQVQFELTNKLTLSTGIRWSQDRKDASDRLWAVWEFAAIPLDEYNDLLTTDPVSGTPNGNLPRLIGMRGTWQAGKELDDEWSKVTGHLNLSWRPNDQTLAYASITTGYRAGGYALGYGQLFSYDEEDVLAYEIGYKADTLDGRLRTNLSAYLYDYKDHQIAAVQPVSCGLTPNCVVGDIPVNIETVQNIPEARSWGIELETTLAVTGNLTVGVMYSYMNTEVTEDWIISKEQNDLADSFENIAVNAKGFDLTRSPEHKYTVWANYNWPMGERGTLNFLTFYGYTGKQYQDVLNVKINEAPSFDRWDARITWDSPTKKYRVAAYINNIMDELGIISLETAPNFGRRAATTMPRTWGVQFKMKFGTGG